jgi:hypothetical protein
MRRERLMSRAPRRRVGSFYVPGVEGGLDALGRCGMHYAEVGEYGFATLGCEEVRQRNTLSDH